MNKKQHISTKAVVAIGASVAALAATSYYFFGPNSKSRQQKLKGWMIKMKGEIIEKMETSENITEAIYKDIVDTIATTYKSKINEQELSKFVASLKTHWKNIQRAAKSKQPAKKVLPKKTE